jgi:ABC-2 type transport system ATP-binding protein
MTDAAALCVRRLSHAYGARKALDDVSFSIERGAFAVLLGLNGAGKSTLFSLVTGLYSAGGGRVNIFGFDIAKEPGEALRRLGVVFQARTLDLELSVTQNLLYHAALHGIGPTEGSGTRVNRWSERGCWTAPATRRAISPADRCGASKSPGRCCTRRSCCCSTSRPSASI